MAKKTVKKCENSQTGGRGGGGPPLGNFSHIIPFFSDHDPNLQLSYPGGWASLVVRLGLSGTLEVDWQVGGMLIAGDLRCFQGWADPCRRGWGWQGGGGCVSNRS